ncbi:MAG: hypothetical protein FWG35_07615, partial [Spirochaetaceae bacterium]|nr:hypothetical protein [Spirochaetaceae bacterium]
GSDGPVQEGYWNAGKFEGETPVELPPKPAETQSKTQLLSADEIEQLLGQVNASSAAEQLNDKGK